jgi:clan AA aspartic protease (TIGR02281 family)
VNGQHRGRFLLDTGASVVVVSPAFAATVGAKPREKDTLDLDTLGGRTRGAWATLTSLKVGGAEVRNAEVIVHPPGGELDGILGNTFLNRWDIALDPDRRLLRLRDMNAAAHGLTTRPLRCLAPLDRRRPLRGLAPPDNCARMRGLAGGPWPTASDLGEASMSVNAPSASYSLTVRLEIDNKPGMLGKITSAIGKGGGDIGAIDVVAVGGKTITRDLSFKARDEAHGQQVVEFVRKIGGVRV